MSKKFIDVLGLKKGHAPELVGTFTNRGDANWHIKNTFEGLGYDKLLTRNTKKKGKVFVQDTVAEDRGTYIKTVATMNITDLEKVETVSTKHTLLELIVNEDVKSASGLGKLELVEFEGNENIENISKQLVICYGEDTAFPFTKVEKKLSTELLDAFIGEEEGDTEEEKKEPEKKETEKKEKKASKKSKDKKEKLEEIDEEEEETVEEDTEEEVEETVEEDTEEVVDEETEEDVDEEIIDDDVEFEEDILDDDDIEDLDDELDEII